MLNNLGRRETKQHSKGQQPHDPAVSRKKRRVNSLSFHKQRPSVQYLRRKLVKLPWMVLVHEMVGLGGSCWGGNGSLVFLLLALVLSLLVVHEFILILRT